MDLDGEHARLQDRDEPWLTFLRWGLGLGVTAVILWLLVARLSWPNVIQALRSVEYVWIMLAVSAILMTFLTRVWRWQALLYQSHAGPLSLLTALLAGQIVNQVLPVIRSGDVVRALWVGRDDEVTVVDALGSIALEKAWDMAALSGFSLSLLIWMPLPDWFSKSAWGSLLMVSAALLVLWLGLRWQTRLLGWGESVFNRLPQAWRDLWMPRIRRLTSALDAIRQPRASARAGLWTLMTWVLGAWANWGVLRAFDESSVPAAIFLLVTLMLGSAVVPTPARLGVYEGVSVVALGLFGVPADRALAIGMVLHAVVLGPPLLAGAALVLWTLWNSRHGGASVTRDSSKV